MTTTIPSPVRVHDLTLDQFLQLEETGGLLSVGYDDIDPLPAEYEWDDRAPKAAVVICAATGGTGKGMLDAELAACVTTGKPMPGEPADKERTPGWCLMITPEDDPNVVVAPRLIAAGANRDLVRDMTYIDGELFNVCNTRHIAWLHSEMTKLMPVAPVRMVIIDPLYAVAPVSLASVAKVREVFSRLVWLASKTGATIVVMHHTTKAGSVAGSQAVVDSVRCVMTMRRLDPPDDAIRELVVMKTNMGEQDVAPLNFKITDDGSGPHIEWVADLAKPLTGKAAVTDAFDKARENGDDGPMHLQAIATATGQSYGNVRVTMFRMVRDGEATQVGDGYYVVPAVTTAGQDVTPPEGVTGQTSITKEGIAA